MAEGRSTRGTVLIAGGANLLITVCKLVAGLLTGSSGMLAEAAHSLADTLNQAFLLTSLRKGARPPDADHPFGYGQERYFWSLLAAFGIFVAGAGFSFFEGVLALGEGGPPTAPIVAYVVLAVAGVAEGTSLIRAFLQLRERADGRPMLEEVRHSADTTVKTALFEDIAAVIGLLIAATGLAMRQITGVAAWDAGASMAIGALLVVVAVRLGADNRELLIGRAADPRQQGIIRREIEESRGVDRLLELKTMQLGPDRLIVAARVALRDDLSADETEDLADDIDRRLTDRLPTAPHVFIDPTQRD